LSELAPFYDWDFRNFKLMNSSQPYTPAFTMMGTNILSKKAQINQSVSITLGNGG
jgi:hypothetical protein